MRSKVRGAGLIECMIAMTIFVSSAGALTSLAIKSVSRITKIQEFNSSVTSKRWLASRLSIASPDQYASMDAYILAVFPEAGSYEITLRPQGLNEAASKLVITEAEITLSYRTLVRLLPKVSPDVAAESVQLEFFRPLQHDVLQTLPPTLLNNPDQNAD